MPNFMQHIILKTRHFLELVSRRDASLRAINRRLCGDIGLTCRPRDPFYAAIRDFHL
jgi:hypothetical protein